MMDIATAARAVGGRPIGPNARFTRVCTDSRTIAPGDLFVALSGERFDGHAFVPAALSAGAAAVLVAEGRELPAGSSAIAVQDPLRALGCLAQHWRSRFAIPVVVVAGSNGKTTVKEMIAAILRAYHGDAAVAATRGNLNNAIGMPLTLLGLREGHRAAVVELGMNHPGETAELAPLAAPTVAVINNAQREHQEFMRGVAAVAAEHASLLSALREGGVAVLNADDPHVEIWRRAVPPQCSKLEFGLDTDADVRGRARAGPGGTELELATPAGALALTLPIAGRHNARNAAAAIAAALASGADLAAAKALEQFRPVPGRLVSLRSASGALVIDDTYNANPDSVKAAIDVLAAAPHPRWLVLGDMGEVGADGPAYHREAGEHARAAGIDRLLTAGTLAAEAVAAFGPAGTQFGSVDVLAEHVAGEAAAGTTILVKGSRFMRMERVVHRLCGQTRAAGGEH